jgi:hypothetical protein
MKFEEDTHMTSLKGYIGVIHPGAQAASLTASDGWMKVALVDVRPTGKPCTHININISVKRERER